MLTLQVRQQKDVLGCCCFQLLSGYIRIYSGYGPFKLGIRRYTPTSRHNLLMLLLNVHRTFLFPYNLSKKVNFQGYRRSPETRYLCFNRCLLCGWSSAHAYSVRRQETLNFKLKFWFSFGFVWPYELLVLSSLLCIHSF